MQRQRNRQNKKGVIVVDKRPIGVFDSGVGGFSVVKTMLDELPNEEIVYFGDTLRAPYGNRDKQTIIQFSLQIVEFLLANHCKAIVVACNTSSVCSFSTLKITFDIPMVEVIGAAVFEAVSVSQKGVGLFATTATINSHEHKTKIRQLNPNLPVFEVACPLMVPIVEEGFSNTKVAYYAAKEYLNQMKTLFNGNEMDALILGCTHYPLMKESIQKAAGSNVQLIDPALGTALELKRILTEKKLLNTKNNKPNHMFYCSGDKTKFDFILQHVLGGGLDSKRVTLPL